ncbi:Cell wall integrity and stress response component protein [Lachnellula hyalina]|uniref:Cell wall integrity and stress response component protein n=1 Tax=Lachnellula hyalina TaxID=1316788 RepID=A0A8H8QUM7_9HELO|nr:Cell wall integrity and stress response component protein [Lachnellula hyalina]TVY23093.1 Cell wall integrity and stress response component protein [Lachnellula hyalina]
MKSISSLVVFGGWLLSASHVAAYGASSPGPVVYKGCYSSSTGLTMNSSYTFNTQGYCQTQCAPLSKSVLATKSSTDCWCGNELPPTADLVSDSHCDAPCAGYGSDMCGSSQDYWSVWLSGVASSASTATADDTSTTSSAAQSSIASTATSETSTTPAVVTAPGSTVVVTAAPGTAESSAAASTSATPKKGANKAAIAAGVVVGVVVISAIAGGIYLFLRNKKRREVEEEYRRNAAVSTYIASGGKPPNSSGGGSSFTDTRLDQATMAQRRMSDGSIADNEDYSRRILKV